MYVHICITDEDNEVQSSVQDDVEDADSREAIEPPKKRSRGTGKIQHCLR